MSNPAPTSTKPAYTKPLPDLRHRYGLREIAARFLREIAGRYPISRASVQAVRGPDSRSAPNSQVRVDRCGLLGVRSPHVPSSTGEDLFRVGHALDRARPDGQECCRRFRRKCRRRRSQENRFMRGKLHRASGR